MLKSGDQIGQFILLNHAGSGGFGDVWKAEKRTALDSNYFALKFFRPKDDRIDFDKIGKELAVWKQLKGLPHIISVIELDRFDDYVYVVSDFADGGSLENWLKDNGGKASSQAEAVKITLEILRGLENLHEKGFVHRDLKPDNILIMNGRHCLADFGVSREIKTHSKATGTAGTMEYMPPEAFEKNPSITQQTDIWAVGVILQKLLTGALPYPQEDYPSLVSAILMYEPEPMPASVPEGLREIVRKTLQKKREDRFQTAREMREALKNPQQFLAERAKKMKDSETIVDEDFDKTELLEIPVTKDWRETKKQYQREEEQAKLEQERLEREKAERQRLESEKFQREAEAKRIQFKREENLRKQKEAENALQRQQEEQQRREAEARRLKEYKDTRNHILVFGGGILGVILFLIWMSQSPTISVSNSNSVNTTTNKPANVASNSNNSANKATNSAITNAGNVTNKASTNSSNSNTFKNSIGMEFVKIPAGSFMMGSTITSKVDQSGLLDDARPQHQVTISKGFNLGKYEVTQGHWRAVMGNNPSYFKACGDNCPVENVSWEDAQNFIKKLNENGEGTYRLPTEAEWEYACRAGTTGTYYGNNLDDIAWYQDNSGNKTHPTGQKRANAFGLYDMHGNVWERTASVGEYSSESVTDPKASDYPMSRGGSFSDTEWFLPSAYRGGSADRSRYVGFRVVKL